MLAAISNKIVEEGMSVENISTDLKMRPNGRRDFVVDAECTTTMPWDREHIEEVNSEFSKLKGEFGMDIVDVRVHTVEVKD